jgi:tetrahydromethanopterin S-methyltransferase subunit G
MTVKENLTRIIRLEDDVEEVKERLYNLETNHLELMTKLETIARIGKLLAIMVSATLGFDLGMEEMI